MKFIVLNLINWLPFSKFSVHKRVASSNKHYYRNHWFRYWSKITTVSRENTKRENTTVLLRLNWWYLHSKGNAATVFYIWYSFKTKETSKWQMSTFTNLERVDCKRSKLKRKRVYGFTFVVNGVLSTRGFFPHEIHRRRNQKRGNDRSMRMIDYVEETANSLLWKR